MVTERISRMPAEEQIERAFREEHGRVLAALISQLGDFALAEDALQDALVLALERWETDGVPRNPGAWLMTVAKRRGIDRLRRAGGAGAQGVSARAACRGGRTRDGCFDTR